MTPELAYAQSLALQQQHKPEEGLQGFTAAMEQANGGASLPWKQRRARYLELIGDSHAREAWTALADSRS